MDKGEARAVLERQLAIYRAKPYEELVKLVEQTVGLTVTAPSGRVYNLEISVLWDDIRERENVRVLASADDCGWRSLLPLCADFIMRPDGSLVGSE